MTVKELFEKYCTKEGSGYICHGRCFELTPASEEEIRAFRNLCDEHGVDKMIVSELEEYYRQNNSFFDYFKCDEESLFDWWEDEDQRSIWLGCVDDDSFIYDDLTHTYALGWAGSHDIGDYETLMEMLEAYLKEGWENGWNS